jgi:hypothetical protein
MKKLLIVLSALVLVFGLAFSALAVNVDVTGELQWTGMTDFDTPYSFVGDNYLDFTMEVDDYNTVVLELNIDSNDLIAPAVDAWYVKTDLGAYFDLPMGLTNAIGWWSVTPSKFEASGHAFERTLIRYGSGSTTGIFPSLDFEKATLDVALGFMSDDSGPALVGENNNYAVLLTIPDVGGAMVEAFYTVQTGAIGDGVFGIDANAAFDMITVAAGFKYDLRDAPVRAAVAAAEGNNKYGEAWAFGVGAKFMSAPFVVDAGINGAGGDVDDRTLNQLGARVGVDMEGEYGADVGIGYSFSDADIESFGGIDISGWIAPGATTWRVGYLVVEDTSWYGGYGCDGSLGEGGFYVRGSLAF